MCIKMLVKESFMKVQNRKEPKWEKQVPQLWCIHSRGCSAGLGNGTPSRRRERADGRLSENNQEIKFFVRQDYNYIKMWKTSKGVLKHSNNYDRVVLLRVTPHTHYFPLTLFIIKFKRTSQLTYLSFTVQLYFMGLHFFFLTKKEKRFQK